MDMDSHGKSLAGLILIGAGVVFLLNQLQLIDLELGRWFHDYWPALLIVVGLHGVFFQARHRGGGVGAYLWNLALIAFGGYWLNRIHQWIDWRFGPEDALRLAVPIALVAFGLSMLFRRSHSDRWRHRHDRYGGEAPRWSDGAEPFRPGPSAGEPWRAAPGGERPAEEPWPEPGSGRPAADEAEPEADRFQPNGSAHGHWHHGGWHHGHDSRRSHHAHHAHHDPHVLHRSNFIGDIRLGDEFWELTPMNISHFIGDTELDLTKAHIPLGETRLTVSAFIGDVKVYVPNDVALDVSVEASSFVGDIKVFERFEGGLFKHMRYTPQHYPDTERRIKLTVNMFIGDVRVTRIG